MITVKEIAKMCDVSPSTVSNILNGRNNMSEETRKKVMDAVQKTGYKPNFYAQGMRRTNNKTIGIIAEELCQFSTPLIVEAIMAFAEAMGYRTFLINMSMYEKWKKTGTGVLAGDESLLTQNAAPAFAEAEAVRADGIIYVAAHGRILDCVPKDFDIPVVFGYGVAKDNKYKSVVIDDSHSSENMIDYIVSKNHKKIGVIAGNVDNFHTVWRMEGYKDALNKNGIQFDESLVEYGDWERESGYECAKKLISKGVDTLWCHNDLMAAGAYDYARSHNMTVGKDISIIGFDDREISEYLYPTLTTSKIMLEDIGVKCAEFIIKEIEDENYRNKTFEPYRIACDLIERDSVV